MGTTSTRIAAASTPVGIALYQGTLYWTDSGTGNVMSWSSGGASAPSVVSTSTSPGPMAVDGSGIYWIDGGTSIDSAPLGASLIQPRVLASGQATATAIATTSTSIFWIVTGTAANQYADGAVMKLAK